MMTQEQERGIQTALFPDANNVAYEQPLSERIRSFLRLEYLFELVDSAVNAQSEWSSRNALAAMIDLSDLLTRTDLKAKLLKELARLSTVLTALQRNPSVDESRLQTTISSLNNILSRLHSSSCQPGQNIRKDELVASIRQRITIPGGTCNFDLPGYHFWLTKPPAQRNAQLQQWLSDLRIIQEAIAMVLGVIRESAAPMKATAPGGFYQQPLDTTVSCHMIRILLTGETPFYPEISAGRHRFTIRFLEQRSTLMRPIQTETDVAFKLERCII